jgi:phytoene synthase
MADLGLGVGFADLVWRERVAADVAECRAMLKENSKTFFAASLMLPKTVREPASALYAFCRMADDAVDLDTRATKAGKSAAVNELRERLELVYAGRPVDQAPDRAFAEVVSFYRIPRALPEALLEGFQWDAEERRYRTFSDVTAYAARVAATVGAMMSILMETREANAMARACDLGVAMQFSNIARDIGEDARAGRVYLPLDWLVEEGIDVDAWLADPKFNPAIGRTVGRLLAEADALYSRVAAGVAVLPKGCQPGINAARYLYSEIGREVERAGMDSVSRRAVVPSTVKAKLLAKALVAPSSSASLGLPVLEECRFLVEAGAANANANVNANVNANANGGQAVEGMHVEPEWWNLEARVVWLVEFLKRMEQRDREQVKLHRNTNA